MFKILIKKRYIFLTVIICFFCISAVSANELTNETNDMLFVENNLLINEEINVQQEDILATSHDEDVICGTNNEWYVNDSAGDSGDELIKIQHGNLQKSLDIANDMLFEPEIYDNIDDVPIDPGMDFNANDIIVGETLEIKVFLPADATGNVTVIMDNKTYSSNVNSGLAVVLIDGLSVGVDQNFAICYSGDDRYFSSHVNSSIDVYPIDDYEITASNATISIDGTAKIVVNVPSDAKGIVGVYVNIVGSGESYESPVVNGEATFEISGCIFPLPKVYYFMAFLRNDPKYEYDEVWGTIRVMPIYNYSMVADDVDVYVNESACLVVELPDDAEGEVYFCIGNQWEYVSICNGTAKMNVSNFEAGNYNFTAIYDMYDDFGGYYYSKYASKSVTGVLRVHKISNYEMNTSDLHIKKGEKAKIIANLPSDANGNASVRIYNENFEKNISAKVENGKIIVDKLYLTKNSRFIVNYMGNSRYEPKSVSGSIFVESNIIINAPDLIKYYGSKDKLSAQLLNESNKPLSGQKIIFTVNGKDYERITDNSGIASMNINLIGGNHTANVRFEGNGTYKTIKTTVQVQIKSTVSGNNVTKIFRNETQYYATFVDTKGNLMKNTDITLNINGILYIRTTDGNGVAKMNINLPPGTYVITAENPDSKEKYTNVIKVLPSIVENYDLTKYYRNESKYTLKIIGDDGNPVGEGVEVKLNINGVFYTRTTNASGYMNMNINLPPGSYTVTAEYNGLRASNKITVLPVLTAKDITMKYRNGAQFVATLVDGQGNPYANPEEITFNINGVFYKKITDSSGQAKLNINLMSGEYIITSMYSNGATISNKVTILS